MPVMAFAGAEGTLALTEEEENLKSEHSRKALETELSFSHPKAFSEKREEKKR